MRIEIPVGEDDDVEFVHLIRRQLVALPDTRELFLVKIDRWFGRNWSSFSGKALGAIPVWRAELTIPPFHPNRVVFERHFEDEMETTAAPLHVHQTSSANLRRTIRSVSSSASFIWYSGDTRASRRGSVMIYVAREEEHAEDYFEVIRHRDGWRI